MFPDQGLIRIRSSSANQLDFAWPIYPDTQSSCHIPSWLRIPATTVCVRAGIRSLYNSKSIEKCMNGWKCTVSNEIYDNRKKKIFSLIKILVLTILSLRNVFFFNTEKRPYRWVVPNCVRILNNSLQIRIWINLVVVLFQKIESAKKNNSISPAICYDRFFFCCRYLCAKPQSMRKLCENLIPAFVMSDRLFNFVNSHTGSVHILATAVPPTCR